MNSSRFNESKFLILEELKGSSKPSKIQDKETKKIYCLKRYQDKNRMINEYCANQIYRKTGCDVPQITIFLEDNCLLIDWIDGILLKDFYSTKSSERIQNVRNKFGRFFVIDCLLANWDVVGLENDNVIVNEENDVPFRIDTGGCMSFRAMGEKKTEYQWGSEFVSEIMTMRDYQTNKNAHEMFKGVSDQMVGQQVERFKNIILGDEIMKNIPFLSNYDKQTIRKRWKYIATSSQYLSSRQQQQQQPQSNYFNQPINQEQTDLEEAIRRSLMQK